MSRPAIEQMLPVPIPSSENLGHAVAVYIEAILRKRGLMPRESELDIVKAYVSPEKVFVELNFLNPNDQGEPSQTPSTSPSTDPAGELSAPSKPAEPVNPSQTTGPRRAPRGPASSISES